MSTQQQVQPRPPQHMLQHQQQPWWAGPMQGIGSALQGMQHNLQQLASNLPRPPHSPGQEPFHQAAASKPSTLPVPKAPLNVHHSSTMTVSGAAPAHVSGSRVSRQQQVQPVTKEELGRSTWVFLHTLAAQFPEHPTRQQQRDARQLVDSLTRIYPCADCAQHFQEIVRRDPPDVSSGATFSQWMCRVHNAVNRRLGKPVFSCDLVAARWAPLDCDQHNSCDMTVGRPR